RVLDAVATADLLHEADRALDRSRRVLLETEGEREIEEHLGVGRALDQRIECRADLEHEITLEGEPVADEPVVHPEPLAVVEGMAVRLPHRRTPGRAGARERESRVHGD